MRPAPACDRTAALVLRGWREQTKFNLEQMGVRRGGQSIALMIALLVTLSGCGVFPTEEPSPQALPGPTITLPLDLLPNVPPTPPALTPAPDIRGDPVRGRVLLIARGCGGCHTVRGVPGAMGATGPNLTNIAVRPTLAGLDVPMAPESMVVWIMDPQALKPTTPMPDLGIEAEEAWDITAFLFSQPYNPRP